MSLIFKLSSDSKSKRMKKLTLLTFDEQMFYKMFLIFKNTRNHSMKCDIICFHGNTLDLIKIRCVFVKFYFGHMNSSKYSMILD